jgi:hypothetical protein
LKDTADARKGAFVGIRTLLSALFALVVLFSPMVTNTVAAHMAGHDHQMQLMEAGHCKSVPSADHQKLDGKSCCISMCTGLAVAPSAPATETPSRPSLPIFTIAIIHLAHVGEIATPPPRHA